MATFSLPKMSYFSLTISRKSAVPSIQLHVTCASFDPDDVAQHNNLICSHLLWRSLRVLHLWVLRVLCRIRNSRLVRSPSWGISEPIIGELSKMSPEGSEPKARFFVRQRHGSHKLRTERVRLDSTIEVSVKPNIPIGCSARQVEMVDIKCQM
jgi:hypothetical protein